MSKLQLQLVTPVETLIDQEVDEVVVPTGAGQITVLANHSPLVTTLANGELLVRANGEETPVHVAGGALEVSGNVLRILADAAENAHSIDVEAVEKRAAELAEMLKTEEKLDMNTYNQLQRQLAAEQSKLKTGRKWKG